jgi:hypothetical protein
VSAIFAVACGARSNLEAPASSTSGSVSTSSTASSASSASSSGSTPGLCHPGDGPVKLAAGLSNPAALAISDDFVYFVAANSDGCQPEPRVNRVPKMGGGVEPVASTMRTLAALAVDDQNVYWSDDPVSPCTSPADQGYAIVSAPKAGGATVVFPFSGQLEPALDIAVDGTHVYWVSGEKGGLRRAAKGGGQPELLDTGGEAPISVAVFGDDVYWTSVLGLRFTPKAGGPMTKLDPSFASGTTVGVAVDATGAYSIGIALSPPVSGYVDFTAVNPEVLSKDKFLEQEKYERPQRLTIDSSHVYWTILKQTPGSAPGGAVMRVSKTASVDPMGFGKGIQIATAQAPRGVAVDDTCVYWSDVNNGSVWRAPK